MERHPFHRRSVGKSINRGDAADPDQDGLSNLLEYVFNRDPRLADNSPAVTATVNTQEATRNSFLSYPHNRNATDLR
jgi:hypothetical protein